VGHPAAFSILCEGRDEKVKGPTQAKGGLEWGTRHRH